MILAIDVGNTNIVLGVFKEEELVCSGRFSTEIYETQDEYAMKLASFLKLHEIEKISGAIISSVVPALVGTLRSAVRLACGVTPMILGPGVKTGLKISIDNPGELGADMVAGAVAAKAKYPCPQIIFDFGTATTASVIDKSGAFIGCLICCGVKTSINAIASGTAQLPQIDISAPSKLIGTNSAESMKSGIVYGTASMVEGIISRIEAELGEKANVIVTGGFGRAISKHCKAETVVDENLLLDGLRIIYNKNNEGE